MFNRTTEPTLAWDDWYLQLRQLAQKHGLSVADKDAWMSEWEDGKSPSESLYGEYPEHRPMESCQKQHSTPCRECPFKRASSPGWLGAAEPGEFLALADSDTRTPCHMHVDYEDANWKRAAKTAPQCVGRAIFSANRCKLPAPGLLKAQADHELVFTRPHEFVAHHARVDPTTMESTLLWDLYEVRRAPLPTSPVKRKKRTA